jgi:hypothetical protein
LLNPCGPPDFKEVLYPQPSPNFARFTGMERFASHLFPDVRGSTSFSGGAVYPTSAQSLPLALPSLVRFTITILCWMCDICVAGFCYEANTHDATYALNYKRGGTLLKRLRLRPTNSIARRWKLEIQNYNST